MIGLHILLSNRYFSVGLIAALCLLIFIIDLNTPLGVAGGIPYLLPVFIASRFPDIKAAIWTALVCTGLTLLGLYFSPEGGVMWQVLENRALSLFVIWSAVWFIVDRRKFEKSLSMNKNQLSEANLFLNSVLKNMVDSLITIDDKGLILSANKATETIFGYTEEEIKGNNIKILMPEPYHGEHDNYLKNYLETGEKKIIGIGREAVGKRKDGSIFPIDIAVSEVFPDDTSTFTGIIRDVSERVDDKRNIAEQMKKLEQMNEELEQFNYIASHDLKAPLRAIYNYADFLTEDLTGKLEPEDQKYLDSLGKAVSECDALINDLLALSKIGREDIELSDSVSLGDFIDDILGSMNIDTNVSIVKDNNLPTIQTNERLLKQALKNIIDNGIKFNTSDTKIIKLSCSEMGDSTIEIKIEDNGIGIEDKYLGRITQAFQRLHTGEEYEGTGIGLAIVKKAIEYINGTVRIESRIGAGTSVYLTLPM